MPDKLEVPSDDELDPAMVARLAELPPLNVHRFMAPEPTCFEGWKDLLAGIYSAGLDPLTGRPSSGRSASLRAPSVRYGTRRRNLSLQAGGKAAAGIGPCS